LGTVPFFSDGENSPQGITGQPRNEKGKKEEIPLLGEKGN